MGSQLCTRIASYAIATDVRGGIVPLSGHWIAEERPDFLIQQLFEFFGNSTTIGSE